MLDKRDTYLDWQSPVDPRFSFSRLYSSSSDGLKSYSEESFGASWWSQFETTIWQTGNTHILYREGGSQYEFFGPAYNVVSYPANLKDHPYRMWRAPNTPLKSAILYVSNGRGREEVYTDYLNFNGPNTTNRFLKLSEIRWADGYKITITRNAQNRISTLTDNKGQRAEFTWLVQPGSSPTVAVVGAIQIDTAFDGSTFDPDVEIDLSYEFRSAFAFAVYTTSVVTKDLNTTETLRSYEYGYADTGPLPARLLSVRDGRLNGNGAPFNYAEFIFGAQQTTGDLIATSTALAGGADQFTASMSASGDVYVTNPLGKQSIFDVELVDSRKRIVAAQGVATASCLGTAISVNYTPPGGMPAGWVYSQINRNGSITTYTRDARGLVLTKSEDATGISPRVTGYTWHATLRLPLTRTTPGLLETFTYTAEGLLTSYSMKDTLAGSPSLNQVRTWTYGYTTLASGLKVLTTVDGPGLLADGITDVTTYTYTALGELATATDPNGLVTTVITRNDQGQPTTVEQADKSRWTFTYDRAGRILTAGFAGQGQAPLLSSFTYDIVGQILSYTNTHGKTWTFNYDEARRLTQVSSPSGDRAEYSHDLAGNPVKVEYRNGSGPVEFWEDTEFDELSRILNTVGAMGQEWAFAHDEEDNLTDITDPLTFGSSNGFDALNQMIGTVDRESYSTEIAYNPQDQVTNYTDPRMISTTFTYDGFGSVVAEVSSDRGTTSYSYDRRALVTSRTDGRGTTVTYGYDNGGRLILIDYPAGGIGDIAFTWDQPYLGVPADANKGQVGRIDDGTIRMDFGHEVTASGPRVTMSATYPASRSYTVVDETDFEGNPVWTAYPSGREVLVDVDDDNRISRIRLMDGATTTVLLDDIAWAPNGPMLSALYGDGFTQTRSYDLSYRLTGIADSNGTVTHRDLAYDYESRDNLTAISDAQIPGNSETFGYTPRESLSAATGPYGSLAFTYDGVGNRVTAVAGASTDSYSYPGSANRLSSIAFGGGGSRGFAYDGAGNVITDTRSGVVYDYTYNAANRLSALSIGGTPAATYTYDAMGRQAIRSLSGSGVTIHSVFDSQGRRIAEYNEATGALIREYVWMGWEPVALVEGGVIYYVRADHIGRPVFATDASGIKVWSASYLPFGGVHVTTGAAIEARFPGQWFQSESGLHQNWMRDYDPTMGRYLQADPLGLVAGMSIYGYALQNPGRYTDPRGENPAAAVCAIPGFCAAVGRAVAQICIEGAKIVVGAAIGIFATTTEGCGCDENCPLEVDSLAGFRKLPNRGPIMDTFIEQFGHPHDWKDDSDEDLWRDPKTGCVYVGDKQGVGRGRLVGKLL